MTSEVKGIYYVSKYLKHKKQKEKMGLIQNNAARNL